MLVNLLQYTVYVVPPIAVPPLLPRICSKTTNLVSLLYGVLRCGTVSDLSFFLRMMPTYRSWVKMHAGVWEREKHA